MHQGDSGIHHIQIAAPMKDRHIENKVSKLNGKGAGQYRSNETGREPPLPKAQVLTRVSLLRESVWLGGSVLATNGRIVECLVGIRGGRRFAGASNGLLVFFFLSRLYFLFIEEERLAHTRL